MTQVVYRSRWRYARVSLSVLMLVLRHTVFRRTARPTYSLCRPAWHTVWLPPDSIDPVVIALSEMTSLMTTATKPGQRAPRSWRETSSVCTKGRALVK